MIDVIGGPARVRVGGAFALHARDRCDRLSAERVPAGIMARSPALWNPAIAAEAVRLMSWLDLPATSAALVAGIPRLAADLDHVVLLGMGGSSLAAEVIAAAAGRRLAVLDTTDPHQVRPLLAADPARLLVVLSSKSGRTIESDSLRRIFVEHLTRHLGPAETPRHVVAVTDPESFLHHTAGRGGFTTFLADKDVGGRFSALGPFGLVAPGLLGADVATIVADAARLVPHLSRGEANPALLLGAALATAAESGADRLMLTATGASLTGLPHWVEQLVSESSGKDGRGMLPVVGAAGSPVPPGTVSVALTDGGGGAGDIVIDAPLGAQFLLWEYAITVACRELRVNPFDQPDVEESKANTLAVLAGGGSAPDEPAFVSGPVEVRLHDAGTGAWRGCTSLPDVLGAVRDRLTEDNYLAVMAFLDRIGDARIAELADALRHRTKRAVTFGWGPRFLHSSGQLHKGGPPTGIFLQITGDVAEDIAIPGRAYSLGRLQAAQAEGDRLALGRRGRPLVHLHLRDRAAGIDDLLAAAAGR